MKHVARTALVSFAFVALLQSGCPSENGTDNTGGRGGSGGAGGGGTGGGGTGGGGTGGGGTGGGGTGGKAPDAGVKRDTGKAPDSGKAPDGGRSDAGVKRDGGGADSGSAAGARMAVADIQAVMGGTITGKVTFAEVANGVQVTYALENCPAGTHPTHIHEGNGCDSVQAQGMHWDPPRGERINNDQVVCGQDGKGSLVYVRENAQANLRWTIGAPAASDILGHPVVIHGVNNANQRHGCGVIRMGTATAQPY